MTLKNPLYLCSMPKGENEDLLPFMVPKEHRVTALNGCHQDARHQGHDHTLSLLQEYFWWPWMANQVRQSIKACTCYLQYEGGFPKAPLHPIVATAPLDLLHVDLTSIETTFGAKPVTYRCQCLGVLRPLHEACIGICDPQPNCKNCC